METRKLQEVGGGTYTVSVPKRWAEDEHLAAGAEVYLSERGDGTILLSSEPATEDPLGTAEVAIDDVAPEGVGETVRQAYVAGFRSIDLTATGGPSAAQRRAVDDAVRSLVGAITDGAGTGEAGDGEGDAGEPAATRTSVRFAIDPAEVSVRQSVGQLRHAARATQREGAAAFATRESAADRLRLRLDEADRQHTLVARQANRARHSAAVLDQLSVDRPALADAAAIASSLHAVAELGVALAEAGERRDGGAPIGCGDRLIEAAEAAREAVDDAVAAAIDEPDPGAARVARRRADDVTSRLASLDADVCDAAASQPGSGRDAVATVRALDAVERTATEGAAIARVALRAGLREGQAATDE